MQPKAVETDVNSRYPYYAFLCVLVAVVAYLLYYFKNHFVFEHAGQEDVDVILEELEREAAETQ